ncbi:MAG: S1 family peptidase [Myxococcota bacterium]|nr:S1 family peptidase [Myxococcota bacterium]
MPRVRGMYLRCTAVALAAHGIWGCVADLGEVTELRTSHGSPPDDEPTVELIPPDEGGSAREPVVGGTVSWERPEIGSLSVGCTGTLVAPNVVVTAAHCMGYGSTDRPGNYGSFTVYDASGRQVGSYPIQRYRSFGYGVGDADIAVLQLSRDVPESAAVPAPLGLAPAERGATLTIWGFGCTRRGYGTDWRKRRFYFLAGQTTYNLCPGDSGGPVTGPRGEVLRVNSGYYVGPGDDIFGDVVRHSARIVEQIRAYRPGWEPRPGGGDRGGDTVPDPGGGSPRDEGPDPCTRYASTCASCTPIAGCGFCGASGTCVSVDSSGRAVRGCASGLVRNPAECPGAGPMPEPRPAPSPPSPPADRCGIYAPWPEYTCRRAGRGFVRCRPGSTPEFLVCPEGYACVPGSRRLLCYWGYRPS